MDELKQITEKLVQFSKDRDWEQFHKPKAGLPRHWITRAGQRRIDLVQLKILAQIYKKNLDFFIE